MEIKINRNHSTRLYTIGTLSINGKRTTLTVEDTISMLPVGSYEVRLSSCISRWRQIVIINRPGMRKFCAGGSYLSSRKHHAICIGEDLIPGALKKGADVYNRLFDRIEKAELRKEPVTLVITEAGMTTGTPISHWL